METEGTENSDRQITGEPPCEGIVEIDAILSLGALPVCKVEESIINLGLSRRWFRPELTLLTLGKIEERDLILAACFTESIRRAKSNSESGIVVTSETDAGARACGTIGKINVHSYACPGDETSAIVESDRFCLLRVIDGTARPAPVSPTIPGDRRQFCSVLADSPIAIEIYRGRSPP